MKLSEFIEEVLTEIVSGVRAAQSGDSGAFVVPGGDGGHDYAKHPRLSASARLKSTIVDFDIALTVEEASKGSGSGGLKVLGVGANVQGELSSKDTTVSRIQFAVPLLLPESNKDWYQALTGGGKDAV